MGFFGGSDGKESTCNAGDKGLMAGSGRSSGEGKGYPLRYSCLQNSVDRGDWWAMAKSWTRLIPVTFRLPDSISQDISVFT